jgi:hypothetical protein
MSMSTHTRYDRLEQMDDAEAELRQAQRRYLEHTGWKYTSSTPGSIWMWRKKLANGDTLLMFEKDAVHVQKHLDQDEEPESSPESES